MTLIGLCSCASEQPQNFQLNVGIFSNQYQKAYFKNYELSVPEIDKYIVVSPVEYEFLLKYVVELKAKCEANQ
jgi:hypothetical protein